MLTPFTQGFEPGEMRASKLNPKITYNILK
jgi:hypothetical protein